MRVLRCRVGRITGIILVTGLLCVRAFGLGQAQVLSEQAQAVGPAIVREGVAARVLCDEKDFPGVLHAVDSLRADLDKVSGAKGGTAVASAPVILVGSLERSAQIQALVAAGKLKVESIKGKWEAHLLQAVKDPLPGVAEALVIVGADKRGTIYGVYELSEQMGVSPWAWWADVPVTVKRNLVFTAGSQVVPAPVVKYRGIFLNDEAPALSGWTKEKFGGFNSKFYTKVFELILRLRGNYMWPAMWDNAFNEDDPLNPKLADEYGVVMGTSHHEPMIRSQQEWKRHGSGHWDYHRNEKVLADFWREGVRRNRRYESIVTMGMRGDGDEPMSEDANISLLEKIVADQREILKQEVDPDLEKVPMMWALYKEVQEYYEKGMRVPDDVILLWCDDNFGNIRRLPTAEERKRKGGAGVYYHFDYVGDPRSYKWINVTPLPKIWEQMQLAHAHGADQVWIVNVGDLKPMEVPIEFFLHLAWNPERWGKDSPAEYLRLWATREFGAENAAEIAELVRLYAKFNGRRKPELLDPYPYSVLHYREAEEFMAEFRALAVRAAKLEARMKPEQRDAFFQLVGHPVMASATVNELHAVVALNRYHASQGRVSANKLAARARELMDVDAALTKRYNEEIAGGKWNHLMDQRHIGYTYWNQPFLNTMPAVNEVWPQKEGQVGIVVEGSRSFWPQALDSAVLPAFYEEGEARHYFDLYNRGLGAADFKLSCKAPWVKLSAWEGKLAEDARIWVMIDWDKVPDRKVLAEAIITVTGTGIGSHPVTVRVQPRADLSKAQGAFVDADGYVSIEAIHAERQVPAKGVRWDSVADLGRGAGAMTTFPQIFESMKPGESPCVEYLVNLRSPGVFALHAYFAPSLAFQPGRGLRVAFSVDDQPAKEVDLKVTVMKDEWSTAVIDNVLKAVTKHEFKGAGLHRIKVWAVDSGVVLQKLVLDTGGLKPSYLGPRESLRAGKP